MQQVGVCLHPHERPRIPSCPDSTSFPAVAPLFPLLCCKAYNADFTHCWPYRYSLEQVRCCPYSADRIEHIGPGSTEHHFDFLTGAPRSMILYFVSSTPCRPIYAPIQCMHNLHCCYSVDEKYYRRGAASDRHSPGGATAGDGIAVVVGAAPGNSPPHRHGRGRNRSGPGPSLRRARKVPVFWRGGADA